MVKSQVLKRNRLSLAVSRGLVSSTKLVEVGKVKNSMPYSVENLCRHAALNEIIQMVFSNHLDFSMYIRKGIN